MYVPPCISCIDVHCKNQSHIDEIDDYITGVLDYVDSSIATIIRENNITPVNKKKAFPGWNDEVKPFVKIQYSGMQYGLQQVNL